jgi:hypothetical protein
VSILRGLVQFLNKILPYLKEYIRAVFLAQALVFLVVL